MSEVTPPAGTQITTAGFGASLEGWYPDGMLRMARNRVEKIIPSKRHSGRAAIKVTKVDGISCRGDSGGPLIYNGRLAGVLFGSASYETCETKSHSFYASVAHHQAWIETSLQRLLVEASGQTPEALDK